MMDKSGTTRRIAEPDFRTLFEATPSPYLVLTPDFTIVAANDAYLGATRTSRADITGRRLFDVFPENPDDPCATGVTNLRASLERVMRERRAHTMAIQKYDLPVRDGNGTTFEEHYWSTINTPVFNAQGTLTHIIHRVKDVTEFADLHARAEQMESELYAQALEIHNANIRLREANEELDRRVAARTEEIRREREYFRSLLMALPVPVSVLFGPQHLLRFENEAHHMLTGARDVIGKPVREAFPDIPEWIVQALDSIYQTGEPYRVERQKLPYEPNPGHPEEGYFAISWHPLLGADGCVEGVIAATVDITAQVNTEERLRESEEFYRIAVDAGHIGTWCIDPQSMDGIASPTMEEIMGLAAGQRHFPSAEWEGRIVPEDRDRVRQAIAAAISSGIRQEVNFRIRRDDGEVRCLQARGKAEFDERGTLVRVRGAAVDVTEQVRTQDELRIANEKLNLAIAGVGEGVWDWDLTTGARHYSPQVKAIIGYTDAELPDERLDWPSRIHPEDAARVHAVLKEHLDRKTPSYICEYRVLCRDGKSKWVRARGMVVARDAQDKPVRMTGMLSDISESKEADERIWHLANFDVLTDLPNRRLFRDRLEQDVKQAARQNHALALLLIDLDRFKQVNDSLGHDTGDHLLVHVAQRIRACVRDADTVARLGGDEFTVILNELDDNIGRVDLIAEKILHALGAPFDLGVESVNVSGSIGIALYPSDAATPEDLMRKADQAMYFSKHAGKNRFSYFTHEMDEKAHWRHRVMNELRRALRDHHFEVHYQPVVDLASGRIVKAEALIRWNHPDLGAVEPAQFIPLAEEAGLIGDIGDWVFRDAVLHSQRWSDLVGDAFQIAINKSPLQFQMPQKESWIDFLRARNLGPQHIAVEITEGLLMDASDEVADRLLAYKTAGIQVAIDDFGTGHSSMAYLKRFDIDYLKIDQSFVRDMAADATHRTITESIIVMAHRLGLKVIAEGVETLEQLRLLEASGCDYAQGYLFARPCPAPRFERMLATGFADAMQVHLH